MVNKNVRNQVVYVRLLKTEKKAIEAEAKANSKKVAVHCREKLLKNVVVKP